MSNYEQGNGGQTGHNFKTDTIEDIHNSEYTRNLRKKFLKGYKPIECNTCWVKEKNGGQSRRMFTNRMYKHLIDYEKVILDHVLSVSRKNDPAAFANASAALAFELDPFAVHTTAINTALAITDPTARAAAVASASPGTTHANFLWI